MLRSIPARRAIRTIGSNAKWMDVAGARGLSNRVKAAGGIMVEKKGTRAQATAAPQAARYDFLSCLHRRIFSAGSNFTLHPEIGDESLWDERKWTDM